MSDTGIIAIQKMVSQPLTRRMNTGSPCTEAHKDLIVDTDEEVPDLSGVETVRWRIEPRRAVRCVGVLRL